MKCIEVTYKSMGEGLPSGVEITQRQLHLTKVDSNLYEAHKNWGPIVYCTAYSKLESIQSLSLFYHKLLISSLPGLLRWSSLQLRDGNLLAEQSPISSQTS